MNSFHKKQHPNKTDMDGIVKINSVKKDIEKQEGQISINKIKNSCLIVKKANVWVEDSKRRPIPKMLFSEFWYENEVCILYSDTNLGKSILAVQIADSISRGVPIDGFKLECSSNTVLYLDFELSDKQFEKRCSINYTNHYNFSANFYRAELNPFLELPNGITLEEHLCSTLSRTVEETNTSILIVDNLTFLSNENEKAKDALALMKSLKTLSREKNLSILVLSHTPKRDNSKPITKNDLSGSKMLMNFCDSAFAIGESSKDSSLRYIKQIKQRNTEHIYDAEHVVICGIKNINSLLGFYFIEYDSEFFHLKNYDNTDIEDSNETIRELVKQGLNNVQIASQLGLTEGAIRKRRKKLGI